MTDYIKRVAEAVSDATMDALVVDVSNGTHTITFVEIDLDLIIASVTPDAPSGGLTDDEIRKQFDSWSQVHIAGNSSLAWKIWHAAYSRAIEQRVRGGQEPVATAKPFCYIRPCDAKTLQSGRDVYEEPGVIARNKGLGWTIPLYLAPPLAVPDGWQLVPTNPTEDMRVIGSAAVQGHINYSRTPEQSALAIYRAMLAAAPRQEDKPIEKSVARFRPDYAEDLTDEQWTEFEQWLREKYKPEDQP